MLGLLSPNTTINLCECLINVSWSNGFAPRDVVRRQRATSCWILKNRVHSCFPLFNATDAALHCKNDLTLSQNALSRKDLILIQFFNPSKFGDAISDLYHQCHQRAESSSAELKWDRTKSGAFCRIFAYFVPKKLIRGRTSKKFFGVLLFSLNLGKLKKYYTFQFSNKNIQR